MIGTNRVGILISFAVLVPYYFSMIVSAFREDPDGMMTTGMRIAFPFIGLVPVLILGVVLWNRLLEALRLR
jgi:hypothetical protein